MKKYILTALLLSMAVAPALAVNAGVSPKDTITDNHIIYPESFDTDTHDMMTNWYLVRYAAMDSMARQPQRTITTDAEYIARLQRLPCIIEMPFNSVVKQYIEMYANKRPQLIQKMLGLSLYYMPIFEEALERHGLPLELKYLPVIESALNPNAVSKAGAAGLWQFMPGTATGKGLEVNSLVDERRDPLRSSEAAASYLRDLYEIYGDWSLVLAAYNCGPGNVNKAIKNSGGKRDFWELYSYLPKETRGYVPAFIAANYIMNNYGHHGISPVAARSPLITDTVHVTNRVNFHQISAVMGITIDELRTLNPQYRQDIIPGNIRPYTLILPSVQAYCYRANEDSILSHDRRIYEQRAVVEPSTGRSQSQSELQAQAQAQSNTSVGTDSTGTYIDEVVIKYHTVQRGETLLSIAQQYGVTVEDIRRDNDLPSGKVKRGKRLKISTHQRTYANNGTPAPSTDAPASSRDVASTPSTAAPATQSSQPQTSRHSSSSTRQSNSRQSNSRQQSTRQTTHVVKSGESLERIARRHGVTVDQLRKANGLRSDLIQPGQTLKVPKKSSAKPSKSSRSTSRSSSRRRR